MKLKRPHVKRNGIHGNDISSSKTKGNKKDTDTPTVKTKQNHYNL